MIKTVIFLEGHTEVIFVKHLLLLHHNWAVDIECNQLMFDGNLGSANYDNKVPGAEFHYRLICVGNDSAVLKSMLKREKSMHEAGYSKIIGLRDMYCQQYNEECKGIDRDIILKFIGETKKVIQKFTIAPAIFKFCYAIMEIEAWMIGLSIFLRIHSDLTEPKILSVLKFNPSETDPEQQLYKPSNSLAQIYGSVGLTYDKSQSTLMSFCSKLQQDDFVAFLNRPTCRSFNYFHEKLFNQPAN